MPLRVKFLIAVTLAGAAGSLALISGPHPHDWVRFAVYLAVILLSAEMKVAMPKGDGTMSVNFPFILLGILQLSPLQAVALAAASVFAQCRIHVLKPFTLAQVAFNLGSVVVSTALACLVFGSSTLRGLELAPALALAATVYFLTNTIPVAMAIGWTNGESAFGLWRRRYPWFLPFYLVGAFFAAIVHLISIQFGWMTSLLIIPTVYTMHRAYRAQIASMLARQRHLEEIKAVHLRTIEALGLAIEAKDQGTHDHLLRVRVYVGEIGRLMGQNEMQLQALLTASFLHDIGKLAVPEHIINKPGRLTPEEFDKMKIHPVVGADILERIRFPYPVTPIVRSHHESWDGSGYPDGLKGEEIPVGARILKVVDCFDALSSNRPYRRALPMDEALAYIKHKAGIEFDPEVTAVLEDHYLELERLAQDDIKSVAPLETSPLIRRGAAPGAGFEQYNVTGAVTEESDSGCGVQPVSAGLLCPQDAFNLIAAATTEAQAVGQMTSMLEDLSGSDGCAAALSFSLRQWMDFDCLAIYIKEGDRLFTHYKDGVAAHSFSAAQIAVGDGLSGWVADSGKSIVNGNPEVEPNYVAKRGSPGQMRSALSLPLCEPAGGRFGVLTLYSSKADAFSKDHLRILLAVEPKLSRALHEGGDSLLHAEKLPARHAGSDVRESAPSTLMEA
jgi:putative nucleotidyltransferase with HDIG domain